MRRFFRPFIAAIFALSVGGCSPGFDFQDRPASFSHLDVASKQAHIDSVRSTLKVFHATALDLRRRDRFQSRQSLAAEVDRYVELQVQPIINDFEAGTHLRTRLEIAQLQLLCARIYLELEDYRQVNALLKDMERRFGDQPDVLNATIDRQTIGYGSIAEGMRNLEERRVGDSRLRPPPSAGTWRIK